MRVAYQLWNHAVTPASRSLSVGDVFVVTLLNPKGLIAALFVFPPGLWRSPALIPLYFGIFAGTSAAIGCAWLGLGASLRALPGSRIPMQAVYRACSIVLVSFALLLLLSSVRTLK
jgi:threonine/homoserine/homoserine lactone efflux protein